EAHSQEGDNKGGDYRPFPEGWWIAFGNLRERKVHLPLHTLLASRRNRVKAYASGLDFHLSDDAFQALFAHAAEIGYRAFKIKVGHPEIERDLKRLDLLKRVVPVGSAIMVDANEAWSAKEALTSIDAFRR